MKKETHVPSKKKAVTDDYGNEILVPKSDSPITPISHSERDLVEKR